MSEYQSYEFVALDRPLTEKQMAELRRISTRAEISPTRFWNEYQWGDLKADPARLLKRYFDAHLYFANWGTHRLMLRLPKARVDHKALQAYFHGDAARLSRSGEHLVLDLTSETEEPEFEDEGYGALAALSALRAELMRGDLRPAYLAWLLAAQVGDVDEDAEEPEVPAGLSKLTAAQEAMAEFLRIDGDLLSAAASGSGATLDDAEPFRRWLAGLSTKEKDRWLRRAADEPELALGGELRRAFRSTAKRARVGARRTVSELLRLAEEQSAKRHDREAARAEKARAAAEAERQRRLAKLGRDIDGAWTRLERLIESNEYDGALCLAEDLRELAERTGDSGFAARFAAMRKRQSRRRGFFGRWKRRGAIRDAHA